MVTINKVLAVGGSDPSGGAGIQADLKTLLELSVFPYTVLAAVTSQNSSRVGSSEPVTARMLRDQIKLLLEDGPIQGLKTGMLGSSENILEITKLISEQNIKFSIIDPVIKANDGSMLASEASIAVLRKRLIPACFMVTPNITEAQILTGVRIENEDDILTAAKSLKETGVEWVLIKGGHLNSDMAVDLLYDGANEFFFETKKIETKNVRGTGCMMASAICAFLVRGLSPEEAVDKAKAYVFGKILRSVEIGKGSLQAVHGTLQNLLAGAPNAAAGQLTNAGHNGTAGRQEPAAHNGTSDHHVATAQNAIEKQSEQNMNAEAISADNAGDHTGSDSGNPIRESKEGDVEPGGPEHDDNRPDNAVTGNAEPDAEHREHVSGNGRDKGIGADKANEGDTGNEKSGNDNSANSNEE